MIKKIGIVVLGSLAILTWMYVFMSFIKLIIGAK